MILFLVGLLIAIFFVVNIFKTKTELLGFKIFKAKKGDCKFNMSKIIANTISKKLCTNISLTTSIDKKHFESLGLINAPVYVLDVKKIGITHLKLIFSSVKYVKQKFNLVLLNVDNYKITQFKDDFVNIVKLSVSELDYKTICLLNCLNVNKQTKFKNQDCSYDFELKNFSFNINNFTVKTNLVEKGVYKIKLPTTCFGYILNKTKTQVCNAFGDVFLDFEQKINIKLVGNNIYFKTNKEINLTFRIYYNNSITADLMLLKFGVCMSEYASKIEALKTKALKELNTNPFITISNEKFYADSLNSYFKLAFLRKQYLNDYILLLKNVFGLSLSNGILRCCPSTLINSDFSVKYEIDSEEYEVNYTFNATDKIKLSYVGHKIGTKDNFVYGV